MVNEETKVCARCGRVRPLKMFRLNANKTTKMGDRVRVCNVCIMLRQNSSGYERKKRI